jgi:predicted DsbA family dithiol-disulfide isomerase
MLGDFVDGKGVTKAEFLRAFNSPSVRRALAQFDAASRSLQINSVPSLVVDDRYRVNMDVGRKQSLEVARYLLELAKKG